MIWLLAHPLSPVSKLDREVTHRKTEKERQLDQGGRGWARSRIIRPQESAVLYKLFNTLW
jgi:hypothetical protein